MKVLASTHAHPSPHVRVLLRQCTALYTNCNVFYKIYIEEDYNLHMIKYDINTQKYTHSQHRMANHVKEWLN